MGQCIFCGSITNEFTLEHVLAEWVRKHQQSKGIGTSGFKVIRERSIEKGQQRREFDSGPATYPLKVRDVCGRTRRTASDSKRCNNGWMSTLEATVKEILAPMMDGQSYELSPDEELVVATWITKTAMVYEYAGGVDEKFFAQSDRRLLMDKLEPPDFVQIWLAATTVRRRVALTMRYIEDEALQGQQEKRLLVFTAFLDRLCCQLVGRRWRDPQPSPIEVEAYLAQSPLTPAEGAWWAATTAQIWPVVLPSCWWPPEQQLGVDGFRVLSERFDPKPVFEG